MTLRLLLEYLQKGRKESEIEQNEIAAVIANAQEQEEEAAPENKERNQGEEEKSQEETGLR